MTRPVEYPLDRKYIGSAMTLFHGAINSANVVRLNILSVESNSGTLALEILFP